MLAKFNISRTHAGKSFPEYEGSGIIPILPNLSPEGKDLVVRLLEYDPKERMSARSALRHRWFADIIPTEDNVESQYTQKKKSNKMVKHSTGGPSKTNTNERTLKWRTLTEPCDEVIAGAGEQVSETMAAKHSSKSSDFALPNIHAKAGRHTQEGTKIINTVKKTVAAKVAKNKYSKVANHTIGSSVSGPKVLPSIELSLSINGHKSIVQKPPARVVDQASLRWKAQQQQLKKKSSKKDNIEVHKKRTTKIKKARKKSL